MTQTTGRRDIFRAGAAIAAMTMLGGAIPAQARSDSPRHRRVSQAGSRLDPRDLQVLFADLQVPLVATSRTNAPEALSGSAAVLARVATLLQMPALYSVVPEGTGAPHLIPELKAFSNSSNTILRTPVSPFHHAETAAALAKNGRKTIIIAGFAAEAVVLQAALDGLAAGYSVFYVVDAVGSASERTEGAAFREMENAGAVPTSVLSLSVRLVNDFITSPGKEVMTALQPVLGH